MDETQQAAPAPKMVEVLNTVTIELCKYGLVFVNGSIANSPSSAKKLIADALPGIYKERKRKPAPVAKKGGGK